jgi:hypothetical protein
MEGQTITEQESELLMQYAGLFVQHLAGELFIMSIVSGVAFGASCLVGSRIMAGVWRLIDEGTTWGKGAADE